MVTSAAIFSASTTAQHSSPGSGRPPAEPATVRVAERLNYTANTAVDCPSKHHVSGTGLVVLVAEDLPARPGVPPNNTTAGNSGLADEYPALRVKDERRSPDKHGIARISLHHGESAFTPPWHCRRGMLRLMMAPVPS